MIEINLDDVPLERRDDPRLQRLLTHWQERLDHPAKFRNYRTGVLDCFDEPTIKKICLHEAGHWQYARQFGDAKFCGPSVAFYDNGFHFRPASIEWSNSRCSNIDDIAKAMLAGPFVTEVLTGAPDRYLRGDIANLRRYIQGMSNEPLNEDWFELLVARAKAAIIIDLQNLEFVQEIRKIADEFFKTFKGW